MTESLNQNPSDEEGKLGGGKGPGEADTSGDPEVLPDIGGYEGRDPKTEMPRIPTVPETQDDPKPHGGAPPPEGKPQPGAES